MINYTPQKVSNIIEREIIQFIDFLNQNRLTDKQAELYIHWRVPVWKHQNGSCGFAYYDINKQEINLSGFNDPVFGLSEKEYTEVVIMDLAHEYYHHYQNINGFISDYDIEDRAEQYAVEIVEDYYTANEMESDLCQ